LLLCQSRTSAADLWSCDQSAFPGALWLSEDGGGPRLVHRREPTANPAFPAAVMKIGRVAAGPDAAVYFCSGLDGYVLGLLEGRHEVLSLEHAGQIRDLSCGDEEHVVYYSVVSTPQNGEPLADGKIYRRDLWSGRPAEVATIRQADVGGNWWGTFTVREGVVYLATTEQRSRLFRVASGAPEPAFVANERGLRSLEAVGEQFVVVDDAGDVLSTRDFVTFEPVAARSQPVTDIAWQP
jgi:hypothetical protein